MIELREWLAGIIFFSALAGLYFLFWDGFEWSLAMASLLSFFAAYFIWPSKRRGLRHDEGRIADIFEVLIEFPIEVFLWVIRLFGRLLGGKSDGIDIDF